MSFSNEAEFEVYIAKDDFKFNCSHFIAYKGFRERLHGHNYKVGVRVIGVNNIENDGYVIDFGDIKKIIRDLCKDLNEYFLVPMNSDVMNISHDDKQICILCEDDSKFVFPSQDCKILPICHSSAEELSHYLWCRLIRLLGLKKLKERNIRKLEISVAEAPQQLALYRNNVPESEEDLFKLEMSPIKIKASPCIMLND